MGGYSIFIHIFLITILLLLIKKNIFYKNYRWSNDKKNRENILINETTIINGIKNKEFYIVYQPQVDIAKGRLYGLEALVRWNNSNDENITPDRFITIAEENKTILDLGRWIIEEVCKQLYIWNKNEYNLDHVSINISAIELLEEGTVVFIRDTINKYNINPGQLIFEITESNSAKSHEIIYDNLIALRNLGVKIAVDDFGKGYSALSYLIDLPINIIKIDKVFIDNIHKDNRIMKMIINLCESMGFDVIAEGVETKDQLERVNEIGCVLIQGYYYEKPIIANHIESKYLRRAAS